MPTESKKRIQWSKDERAKVLAQAHLEREKDPRAHRSVILQRAQRVLHRSRWRSPNPQAFSPSQDLGKWFSEADIAAAAPPPPAAPADAPAAAPAGVNIDSVHVGRVDPGPRLPGLRRFLSDELIADIENLLAGAIRKAQVPREAHVPAPVPPTPPPPPGEPPKPLPEDMKPTAAEGIDDPRERYIANCVAAGLSPEEAGRIYDVEHPAVNGAAAEWPTVETPPRRHNPNPTLPAVPREKQPVVLVSGLKARQAQDLEMEFGNLVRLKVHANGDGPKLLRQMAEGATDAIVTGWVSAPARAMLKARLGKDHVEELPAGELANGVRRVLQKHIEKLAHH